MPILKKKFRPGAHGERAHACAAYFADTVPGTLFARGRGLRVLVGVGQAQRAGGGVKLRV